MSVHVYNKNIGKERTDILPKSKMASLIQNVIADVCSSLKIFSACEVTSTLAISPLSSTRGTKQVFLQLYNCGYVTIKNKREYSIDKYMSQYT